jgi:micrococcal nuclease
MLRLTIFFRALVLFGIATEPSWAARRGTVTQILDGATLILDDGTGVRLAGIEPVLAAPGGNPRWDDAARSLLTSLVAGRAVVLRGAAATQDRYGRAVAQLFRDDGAWIEGALLEAGAVRVEPPEGELAGPMLRREA